ncbi:MAG: 4Fe-4S binding protein [Eubacterium sp.]|nr:4Fe-4S binding protein [Eubacterium sp.]
MTLISVFELMQSRTDIERQRERRRRGWRQRTILSCVAACPQGCIRQDSIPFRIEQEHCLHCENCMTACPVGAVVRR